MLEDESLEPLLENVSALIKLLEEEESKQQDHKGSVQFKNNHLALDKQVILKLYSFGNITTSILGISFVLTWMMSACFQLKFNLLNSLLAHDY